MFRHTNNESTVEFREWFLNFITQEDGLAFPEEVKLYPLAFALFVDQEGCVWMTVGVEKEFADEWWDRIWTCNRIFNWSNYQKQIAYNKGS